MGRQTVMPDRLTSPLKKWFTECVDVADADTMNRVCRALATIQDC
jgi:mRNA interferase MazF